MKPNRTLRAVPLACRWLWPALALLTLFFAGVAESPAYAQQKRGEPAASIHGTISTKKDGTPSGVSGVTVKLTGEATGATPFTVDTDDNGQYEFKNLKAGGYTLSITQPGFKALTRSVTVAPGQALAQDFTLDLETVAEKVEVQDKSETIATENVSAPNQEVSERQLEALPTPMQKIKEVLPITPGVIRTLDGKLSLRGADENQSMLMVNSARTTDPVTGNFSVPIPPAAVQAFDVYKTPYNASQGGFTGGLTTVETKPPTDLYHLQFRNVVPFILGKNGQVSGIGEATPGVEFGGPLFTKKVFFSEVFQYEMKKRTVKGLPYPEDISKRQGYTTYTTLEAILSPRQVLLVTVNAFPFRQQHYDINSLEPPTASNDLDQRGVVIGAADKYQLESGAAISLLAQYMRFDSNAHGQGLADMLITPEGLGGNYFNRWSRRGKEAQFLPSYQFAELDWKGKHRITAGVEVDYRSYFGTSLSHPVQLLRNDGTLEGEVDFSGVAVQNVSDTAVTEFVHDHWVINQHWSLDAGARLSSETTGWGAAFAPRLGLSFSPGQSGRTVIRAGAGLFYSVLPLLAGDFTGNPTRTVSLFDPTGTTLIAPPVTFTNAFVGGVNPLSGAPLPSSPGTTPRNFTWNAEVVHKLRSDITVRAAYLESHTTYLFEINPFTSTTGGASFLGLTNTASSRYHEAEAGVHYSFREHDELNASYIWSRTRGDLNNLGSVFIPFEQPVIRPNVYGILPNDVPHRFITWAIFGLPWKMTASPLIDVHTGQAYSNIDVLQNYVGTPNGQRFAPFFSLDAKIYRDFKIPYVGSKSGKVHHLRLGFYSTNITNYHNFHDVLNNVTAPNFGQFLGFMDRRDGGVIDFVD